VIVASSIYQLNEREPVFAGNEFYVFWKFEYFWIQKITPFGVEFIKCGGELAN